VNYYRKYLFGDATLQDLPDETDPNSKPPRFVINATNVKSGVLWRFARPYMGDYRVGLIMNPAIPLSVAVAASSAFPPFLSPLQYKLDPAQFDPQVAADLTDDQFRSGLVLSDGGVYDNLGLEPAWKRYDTILVSDGGRDTPPDPAPDSDWARHSRRIVDIVQQQVGSLRVRQVMNSYAAQKNGIATPDARKGAYWGLRGIQMDISAFPISNPLPCPKDRIAELARVPTRLAALSPDLQERLINWGYAVCDASLRSFYQADNVPDRKFPYPGSAV
jgi:NTE family protein